MKRSEVFEPLDPPPHGWTRLEARLDARRARRWPMAVAVAAALVLAVVLVPKPAPRVDVEAELWRSPAAAAFGLPVSSEALTLKDGAAERLPSSDANVLFYRVAVASPTEAPPEN